MNVILFPLLTVKLQSFFKMELLFFFLIYVLAFWIFIVACSLSRVVVSRGYYSFDAQASLWWLSC